MLYLMLAGYGVRESTGAKPSLAPVIPRSPLFEALVALGITPLDKAKVAADKEKLLKKVRLAYRFRFFGSLPFFLLTLATVAATFILLIKLVSDFERTVAGILFAVACLACAFSCYMAQLRLTCFPRGLPISSSYLIWLATPLCHWLYYQRFVPDDARKKVTAIKEALPAAEFSVEWMDPDPYLVVILGDESEYIHWWEWE